MTVSLTDPSFSESRALRWLYALKPASWPKLNGEPWVGLPSRW